MSPGPVAFAATKLSAPHVPANLVRRPRLTDRLDHGVQGPLTLLAAPAGAGKSALLSSWVAERPDAMLAWLSLDAVDGDRRRFWRGVLEALRRAGVGDPLASLAVHPTEPVDVVLPALVNALAALDEPVTLVLDDMHEIDGSPALLDLDRLLRRPPAALRIVISTRSDPTLRLGRLRVAGELTEVRASDLAFTLDESAELLDAGGVRISPQATAQLWQRTEGWAAGLRLAALTMRAHDDPERFVTEFAGDDSTIADYLLAEVLAQQPADVRAFLLRIAVVDAVNGELATALTGRADAGRVLTRLEREHALLSSTGTSRSWHRLHPLFAELLRSELAYSAADEVPGLHARAAAWFEAQGQPTEAVGHAAAAEDWPRVGALVGAHWVPLLLEGELQALGPLLDRLPDELVRSQPELALAVAGASVDAGSEERARPWFGVARAGRDRVPEARLGWFDLGIATVGLLRGRLRGDLDAAVRHAQAIVGDEAGAAMADEDSRALAFTNLGIAELWNGEMDRAARDLQTARGAAAAGGRDWLSVIAKAYLGLHAAMTGRYDRAMRLCNETEALASRRGWSATWPLGITELSVSSMALHRGRLDEAERHHARAAELLRSSTDRPLRGAVALHAARLCAARRQFGAAGDALQEAREWLRDWPSGSPVLGLLVAQEATIAAIAGERARAREMLLAAEPSLECTVALAWMQFQDGDAEGALDTLEAAGDGPALYSTHVERAVVLALAFDAVPDHRSAGDALERGLDLAEPNGVRRPFAAAGGVIGPVLRRQVRRGTAHRALLDELIDAVERPAERRVVPTLPETLSDREAAVLRFLPTMMSNQEIAGELFVSVNTVKTHLKSIYRKLDVDDRRGAVRRARELSLLGPA
jgi:LuxR family transcriptional regulator, maltose regulon positive regulatory protein